jgi:hypothetical protein
MKIGFVSLFLLLGMAISHVSWAQDLLDIQEPVYPAEQRPVYGQYYNPYPVPPQYVQQQPKQSFLGKLFRPFTKRMNPPINREPKFSPGEPRFCRIL